MVASKGEWYVERKGEAHVVGWEGVVVVAILSLTASVKRWEVEGGDGSVGSGTETMEIVRQFTSYERG